MEHAIYIPSDSPLLQKGTGTTPPALFTSTHPLNNLGANIAASQPILNNLDLAPSPSVVEISPLTYNAAQAADLTALQTVGADISWLTYRDPTPMVVLPPSSPSSSVTAELGLAPSADPSTSLWRHLSTPPTFEDANMHIDSDPSGTKPENVPTLSGSFSALPPQGEACQTCPSICFPLGKTKQWSIG